MPIDSKLIWIAVGFFGEALFGLRFVVQWIATERKKRSVVPAAFWYLSIAGAAIVLVYAIYRLDPVFIAATAIPIPIYLRNLHFLRKHAATESAAE